MVIRLSEVHAIPDILAYDRVELTLGNIPGFSGTNYSKGGNALRLKGFNLAPPEQTVGQVRVPLFGFSKGFSGNRDFSNQFTMEFYEDVLGGTALTLLAWQNRCSSFLYNNRDVSNSYKVTGEVNMWNTIGVAASTIKVEGIWPITVRLPESQETSTAAIISVTFSCDTWDDDKVVGNENKTNLEK